MVDDVHPVKILPILDFFTFAVGFCDIFANPLKE